MLLLLHSTTLTTQRDNNLFGEFFDTDDKHNTWYVGTKFDEGPFKKFGGALRWGAAFLSEPSASRSPLSM